MLIPFEPRERWIKWKDIERNPHVIYSAEGHDWSRRDDNRLFFIALDRYADYLQDGYYKNEQRTTPRPNKASK